MRTQLSSTVLQIPEERVVIKIEIANGMLSKHLLIKKEKPGREKDVFQMDSEYVILDKFNK